MNFYMTLVRREISENRGLFVYLPAAFTVLASIALIALTIFSVSPLGKQIFEHGWGSIESDSHEIQIELDESKGMDFDIAVGTKGDSEQIVPEPGEEGTNIRVFPFEIEVADSKELERIYEEDLKGFSEGIEGIFTAFIVIMMLVSVIYLLGALHTDRKDKSILFWKSLPITETQTVLSKLLTVAIFVPTVALVCGLIVCLFWMLAGTVFMKVNYDNIPVWEILSSAQLVSSFLLKWLKSILASLWLLPLIGWLLVCSAWAKRAPSLIAIVIPVALIVVESLIFKSQVVASILFSGVELGNRYLSDSHGLAGAFGFVVEGQFWISLIFGLAFIYAAIWLRNHRFEI